MTVKSTMSENRNIHESASRLLTEDSQSHDHIFIYRNGRLRVLDTRWFRAAECDTDYYLMLPKFRQRLAVNKETMNIFLI